jgi:flagellar protein FlgJ
MSITIGSDSLFSTTTSAINTSSTTNKVEEKLNSNLDNATDDEMMDVCKSFESYFVEQMFKEMKKTVPTSDEGNEYVSYFQDMLYQQYADDVTENGNMGIAQMLYESMKRN